MFEKVTVDEYNKGEVYGKKRKFYNAGERKQDITKSGSFLEM